MNSTISSMITVNNCIVMLINQKRQQQDGLDALLLRLSQRIS